MTTYALLVITVGAPLLVLSMGRAGAWLAAALVAVFLAAHAALNAAGARRTLREYERGRCTRCGYDTRGSTRRCPECGDELVSQAVQYWKGRFR